MSNTILVSFTLDPEKDDLKIEKGGNSPDLVKLILTKPACAKVADDFRKGWEDVD